MKDVNTSITIILNHGKQPANQHPGSKQSTNPFQGCKPGWPISDGIERLPFHVPAASVSVAAALTPPAICQLVAGPHRRPLPLPRPRFCGRQSPSDAAAGIGFGRAAGSVSRHAASHASPGPPQEGWTLDALRGGGSCAASVRWTLFGRKMTSITGGPACPADAQPAARGVPERTAGSPPGKRRLLALRGPPMNPALNREVSGVIGKCPK